MRAVVSAMLGCFQCVGFCPDDEGFAFHGAYVVHGLAQAAAAVFAVAVGLQPGVNGGHVQAGALTHAAAAPLGLQLTPGVPDGQALGPQLKGLLWLLGRCFVQQQAKGLGCAGCLVVVCMVGVVGVVEVKLAERLQARSPA